MIDPEDEKLVKKWKKTGLLRQVEENGFTSLEAAKLFEIQAKSILKSGNFIEENKELFGTIFPLVRRVFLTSKENFREYCLPRKFDIEVLDDIKRKYLKDNFVVVGKDFDVEYNSKKSYLGLDAEIDYLCMLADNMLENERFHGKVLAIKEPFILKENEKGNLDLCMNVQILEKKGR